MVRIAEHVSQSNKPLNYVFAEIQLPGADGRPQNTFIGWDTDGHPGLTTNVRMLTQNAHDLLEGNVVSPFPFDADQARYTPQALEFVEMAQPVDNPDNGTQFTQDIVSISCTDSLGAVKFVHVKELELLDAIMKGQLEWNIGKIPSYTLMIPESDSQTLNFILFSPGENNPSNELMYRTFLLKVFKTLTSIDRRQIPPDQKGYLNVLRSLLTNMQEKAAADKGRISGITKIAGELGILNEAHADATSKIAYLTVEQLRYVVGKCQELVTQRFAAGKQE